MPTKTVKEQMIHIYQQLFQYKDMIKDAPPLSIDISTISEEERDSHYDEIQSQLSNVVAYLLGLHIEDLSIMNMLESLKAHYTENDFWRLILLDYIDACQQQAEDDLKKQKIEAQKKGKALYNKIIEYQRQRKQLIDSFANQLDKQKFPIDAKRLFRNYLNMSDIDSKQAWNMLIDNPAVFSPLIVENEKGERVVSISAAKQINKKIGKFIKTMKA